ncbi:MAG TPA: IPT/TIG domain-containing protein [Myxococcota bacterium]|nr:IPT/TIG domain-containing protein [Myxococcota bacterium]HQK51653.1 IPT/TIG domain-containing protein [Myxococcota bacterium]
MSPVVRVVSVLLLVAAGCSWNDLPHGGGTLDAVEGQDPGDPSDAPGGRDLGPPGLSIASVVPARGPVAGGTRIEVTGTGFQQGCTVLVGSTEASEVLVTNDTTIRARTPPHPAGFVPITVVWPDRRLVRLERAFFYEATVEVLEVLPAEGPSTGGTPVSVRGHGFTPETRLLIGGRQAQDVEVLDQDRIIGLTPPGRAGLREVRVVNDSGTAGLRRGFRYHDRPVVGACDPPVVEVPFHGEVRLLGSGLQGARIRFTAGNPQETTEAEDTLRVFGLSLRDPGTVDVTADSPGGTDTRPACVVALPEGSSIPETPEVLAIEPREGLAGGGDEAVLTVIGLEGYVPELLTVRFGGREAILEAVEGGGRTLRVRTPPGSPGVVDVEVAGPLGSGRLREAWRYLPDVTLESVDPDHGPLAGGIEVTLGGQGLDQVQEVFVGPRPAPIVAGPSPTAIRVRIGPSSPGRRDIRVVTAWGREVVLPGAFVYGDGEPDLVAVSPSEGSWAGGNRVSLVGSGLGPDVLVLFGGKPALVLDATDPARLVVQTPRAENTGLVDVEARWPDGTRRVLFSAFRYFDPAGYLGGVWGEPIAGSVHVTVADSQTGRPVPQAFVMLGASPDTPFRGRTDDRGQVTFSDEDLSGPLQVTATREDYSVAMLAGVDAENLTLLIDTTIPSEGGGGSPGTTLGPAIVTGTVRGVDKYLLAPPASCADRPLVHPVLCTPCSDDATCGPGAFCVSTGGGGFHCATECVRQQDCPEGYACQQGTGGRNGCLPAVGRPEVTCGTSVRGPFSALRNLGPGSVVGPEGTYALSTRLGDLAVYCVGGVRRFDTGAFDPVAMGVVRHVPVSSARVTEGIDVPLDIPLDREIDIRLVNAPGGPNGPNRHQVLVALDLGSDGVIRLWDPIESVDGERMRLKGLPRDLVGSLADAVYYVYGEAASGTSDSMPYSAVEIPDWRPGRSQALVQVSRDGVRPLAPEVLPEPLGACARPEGGGFLVGARGRVWSLSPEGDVTPVASLGTQSLRACAFQDGVLLAAGDAGSLWRLGTGGEVTQEALPGAMDLEAVVLTPDGRAWTTGSGRLLVRDGAGRWTAVPYGDAGSLRALATLGDGTVIGVGDRGLVVRMVGDSARTVQPAPTDRDLLGVGTVLGLPLVVGSWGTALLGDSQGTFLPLDTGVQQDLHSVALLPDGSIVLGGTGGALVRVDGTSASPLSLPSQEGEVVALLPGSGGAVTAVLADRLTLGPFLQIPRFQDPLPGLPWATRRIIWTLEGPPWPSFQSFRIYGLKGGPQWAISAAPFVRRIDLPDLQAASPVLSPSLPALPDLPSGTVVVRLLGIALRGFQLDQWDEASLSSLPWQGWVVQAVRALR